MSKDLKYIILILAFFQVSGLGVVLAQEENATSGNGTRPRSYEENLKRWQGMSEEQREAIRQRVRAMDSQQRRAIRQNAENFRQLPEERRDRMRSNFQRFKGLPPKEREVLRERAQRFQGFPAQRREELRERFRARQEGYPGPRGGSAPGPGQRPPLRRYEGSESRDEDAPQGQRRRGPKPRFNRRGAPADAGGEAEEE